MLSNICTQFFWTNPELFRQEISLGNNYVKEGKPHKLNTNLTLKKITLSGLMLMSLSFFFKLESFH